MILAWLDNAGTDSLADAAYRRIEEDIVTLRLAPGAMTTEQQLCNALGMGRTPVREALLRLAEGYLVRILPRKGLLIRPIEIDYALMTIDVRRLVERLVVERAVRHADEIERAHFAELAPMIEAAAAAPDVHRFMRLDDIFNRLLARAARHEVAARTIEPLHCVSRRLGFVLAGDSGRGLDETGGQHARLMRAIAAGDGATAEAALDTLLDKSAEIARRVGTLQARSLAS